MIFKLENDPYYLAEVDLIFRAWYPIGFNLKFLPPDYANKKLGINDPYEMKRLQKDYMKYLNSDYNNEEDHFEHYSLRLDGVDYPFHVIDQVNDQVCVYMEKGLFTLGKHRPGGYPWAYIYADDDPEIIQEKLYDHRSLFGVVMKIKLDRICSW